MAYLVSQQISEIRLWVLDADTAAPALTDAQYILLLNHYYLLYVERFEKRRFGAVSGAVNFGVDSVLPLTVTLTANNIIRILGGSVGTATGRFLPVRDFRAVLERMRLDGGTPDCMGVDVTSQSPTAWSIRVAVAPSPADALDLLVHYQTAPADITAVGDTMAVSTISARHIQRLAAVEAAQIMGHDLAKVQEIARQLPPTMVNAFPPALITEGKTGPLAL